MDLITIALAKKAVGSIASGLNAKANAVQDTVSGSVATFPDGADNVPLTSLVCSIVPAQSGSGDPSVDNIRPISGWTGMDISHSGEDTSDPNVIEVTWEDEAGTVYGGSLNVLTGVLTADYRLVSFDGTEDWREQVVSSTPTYFYTKVGDLNSCVNDVGVCSHLTEQSGITAANDTVGFRIYNRTVQATAGATVLFRFDSSKQQTKAEFTAYLAAQAAAETPVQVAYKLTQGTEYRLQPHEVKSLLGVNNIWCDTGDTSVTYTADTELYIQKKVEQAVEEATE